MANPSPVDSFFATFTGLKTILYRNISLLTVIIFPLAYQMIIVDFLSQEHKSGACNNTENCLMAMGTKDPQKNSSGIGGGTKTSPLFNTRYVLEMANYTGMMMGSITLCLVADAIGRLKTLFACLLIAFIGGLSSAFAFDSLINFAILRGVVGFAAGGAFPVLFILAAEYVNPKARAIVLSILWAATTLAIMSLAGVGYIVANRRNLMLSMTLPILLGILLLKILPESPRWVLLHSASSRCTSEAQGLLERAVTEDQRQTSKYRDFLSLWEKFYLPPKSGGTGCFTFLRLKEPRKTTIVLGFAWFAVGMLFRGLNMSLIQLLSNFYANFAVRELVNLFGYAVFLVFVTWFDRRVCTVISMILAGVFCLIFSVASVAFLKAEHGTVVAVVQLIGRLCVMVSLSSLSLYSIELFPTVVRCSAMGLATSLAYVGAGLTPLIMTIERLPHPVLPLGIMGCLCLTTGLLCHFLLPKTKGSTAETFEDGSELSRFKSWSPKTYRKIAKTSESGAHSLEMVGNNVTDEDNDEFADLRQSWEVSFDRVSRTSQWEMLTYEDAKRRSACSSAVEQSLDEESHLLTEEDIDKLSRHVPSSTWILVYSTNQHGMSLNMLYHRLRDVETPVLLVVKDQEGFVFGVFSPISPRMDTSFCRFGKSYFFTCRPQFKIYPCRGRNSYYMTGDANGLAFGSSEGKFGLWLDSDLYHGRSTACETYDSEMLSATEDFICLGVEVWTFG